MWERAPLPGAPFELVETFVFYGQPITFTLASKANPDLLYIVNAVDEDDTSQTWLAARLGRGRYGAVRSGLVSFRDLFTGAADTLHRVRLRADTDIALVEQLDGTDTPPEWLPTADARLCRA